jgi:hypothetical protein
VARTERLRSDHAEAAPAMVAWSEAKEKSLLRSASTKMCGKVVW